MQPRGYTPQVAYDSESDVLYIKYGSNRGASAREIGGYIIAYIDDVTDEPRTITIMCYKWLNENMEGWKSMLPISIDFANDIEPLLCH